jgi:hypothetical protein
MHRPSLCVGHCGELASARILLIIYALTLEV